MQVPHETLGTFETTINAHCYWAVCLRLCSCRWRPFTLHELAGYSYDCSVISQVPPKTVGTFDMTINAHYYCAVCLRLCSYRWHPFTLYELAGDSYDWQLAAKSGHSVAVVQTTKFYNSVISQGPHKTLATFKMISDMHCFSAVYQQLLAYIWHPLKQSKLTRHSYN